MQNTLVTVDGRADTPTHTQKQDTPDHFFEREPIGASNIGNRLSTDEQIPFPIQQRVVLRTDISQEDADLTILKLARRAAILLRYSCRLFAALAETRFVDDQDGMWITQSFQDVGKQIVAHQVGVPGCAGE